MSMVCERGWGGQAADCDWSVRSPHPFGMAFGRLKLSPQYITDGAIMTVFALLKKYS
jgi:hypothetical protein